ncbi:MAG: hypothetical protein WCD76_14540 [Pyrinomonadaceae bacterium]
MEARRSYTAPPAINRYSSSALLVGLVALALAIVVSFVAPQEHIPGAVQFFRAYLVAYIFCTGLAVGSLAWLMLQHMTGGGWGLVIRRPLEAATRTIPLMALLFIPLAVSLFMHPNGESLYEWSDPAKVAHDPALQHKSVYLNPLFFIIRAFIYFLVWGVLAYLMNKWSLEQDHTGDPRIRRRMQDVSGPGVLLFGFTVTFAAMDWGMSLEPHWFSTIYGLIIMAGWGLSSLAFMIVVLTLLDGQAPMEGVYAPLHYHDLGKLLLAMVMLFAYFAFSQFLIIWSGNLPEEIPFYLRRLRGWWQYVGLAIVLFHFALPFALLLSRGLKRHGRTLRNVAILMLVMRVVDLIFIIAPAAYQDTAEPSGIHWQDLLTMTAASVGLFGIWLWYYFGELAKRPLLPIGAPDLEKSLEAAAASTDHH